MYPWFRRPKRSKVSNFQIKTLGWGAHSEPPLFYWCLLEGIWQKKTECRCFHSHPLKIGLKGTWNEANQKLPKTASHTSNSWSTPMSPKFSPPIFCLPLNVICPTNLLNHIFRPTTFRQKYFFSHVFFLYRINLTKPISLLYTMRNLITLSKQLF